MIQQCLVPDHVYLIPDHVIFSKPRQGYEPLSDTALYKLIEIMPPCWPFVTGPVRRAPTGWCLTGRLLSARWRRASGESTIVSPQIPVHVIIIIVLLTLTHRKNQARGQAPITVEWKNHCCITPQCGDDFLLHLQTKSVLVRPAGHRLSRPPAGPLRPHDGATGTPHSSPRSSPRCPRRK